MRSWKTTLAGCLLGLIPIAETVLRTLQTGQAISWIQVAIGAGLAVLGLLSKDFDVSGK